MVMVELEGQITEDGQLKVTLPEGLRPGTVRVFITTGGSEESPLLPESDEIPVFEKRSGAEIARLLQTGELDTSAWANITDDPAAWLENLREREQQARQQRDDG